MPEATPKSIAQFYNDLLKAVDGISDEKDDVFLKARGHLAYTRKLANEGDPEKGIAALESAMFKSSCEACEAAMKQAGSDILASFPSHQDGDGKIILELKTPAHFKFITKYQNHLKMLLGGEYDYRGVYARIMACDPTGYVKGKKEKGNAETQETIHKLQLAIEYYASQQSVANSEASTESAPSRDDTFSQSSTGSYAGDSFGGATVPPNSTVELPKYAKGKITINGTETLKATYLLLLQAYWGFDENSENSWTNTGARVATISSAFFIWLLPSFVVDEPIHFLGTYVSYLFPCMPERSI